MANHLVALGYSAPRVLAVDSKAGMLLLEDMGDDTFTRLLARNEDEAALYFLATDVLVDMHAKPLECIVPKGLADYDDDSFLKEVALLTDWYAPQILETPLSRAARRAYLEIWRDVLVGVRSVPESLVLRDYHVDNLIRVSDRDGVAACALLDFQDAVKGPVTYDLVSLIEDARRDVSPSIVESVKARYLNAFPGLDPDEFARSMAVLGAQRHSKVIGIFTRLCVRDGKPEYLRHIPRVWRLLEAACKHPVLHSVNNWLDKHIPMECRLVPVTKVKL